MQVIYIYLKDTYYNTYITCVYMYYTCLYSIKSKLCSVIQRVIQRVIQSVIQRVIQPVYICTIDMYYNLIDKSEIILYTYKTNFKTHLTKKSCTSNTNDWTELHILRKLCMIYIYWIYIKDVLLSYIPDHVYHIGYINTRTNDMCTLLPLLCMFKYYKFTKKPHTVYYTICVWSSKTKSYKRIFIDSLILHELQYIYPRNPYTVSNILGLLKYKTDIQYIKINSSNSSNSNTELHNIIYSYNLTLQPYFSSFAIPNNISVKALYMLYRYLHTNTNYVHLLQNTINVTLIDSHNYERKFTDNEIVYTSLDVNSID